MKVVHLVPAMEQGGVESVVCTLARVLSEAGWEAVVVSKGGRLVETVERNGGRHLALDLKSKNPLTCLFRVLKLRRILRAEKPDLVCVHSRVPAWLYVGVRTLDSLFARLPRSIIRPFGPSIISPPWLTYAHGANSVSRYSEVMTKGDLVVTPSRFLADYLKENYGMSEGKIRVVPNAVDLKRFDPENLDRGFVAAKRREWGIGEGDRVLMAVGRITKVKGLDDLIRRFASERSREDAASRRKLVIVGGADKHHQKYLESLKALAAELTAPSTTHHPPSAIRHSAPGTRRPAPGTGRSAPIVFAGAQSKIPECLSIADEVVSANTTKPESFGLSIAEAYAMNKPVRAKRFGGAAEVMEAVEKAGKPSLREAVRSLYGIGSFAERTLAVYRELTGRAGGRCQSEGGE